MSQPKVFEFAKEIGMETLALMDKIREWKLPVRSHMAELDPDLLDQIKARLQQEKTGKSGTGKKKKVAKKASTSAAAGASGSATTKKSAAGKASVSKKTASAVSETAAPAGEKKTVVVKKAAAKTVIRRKAAEEETPNAPEAAEVAASAAPQVATPPPAVAEQAPVAEAGAPEAPAAAEISEAEAVTTAPVTTRATVVEEAPEAKPKMAADQPGAVAKPAAPVVEPEVSKEPISAPVPAEPSEPTVPSVSAAASQAAALMAAPAAPTTTSTVAPVSPSVVTPQAQTQPTPSTPVAGAAAGGGAGPIPARKREVVMTSTGPVSGVRSEAPRRNIVGRMDLSRVTPPPSAHQGPRPFPGGARSPIQRTLRTGFVSATPITAPGTTEEGSAEARKRFDERKRKFGAGAGAAGPAGAAAKEREAEQVTFSATEFRKREMVFQPKKKKGMLNREARKTELTTPKASKRVVKVNDKIKVGDLAQEMGVKAGQVVKVLIQNGMMATMGTELDFDTVALIAPEFGYEAVNVHKTVDELLESTAFGDLEAEPVVRAPVVTVMGHVDHGKTSLLDAIRKADVVAGEAGGITQHIGAYRVTTEHGHLITFIDTPGHEAFTAMRARGANVTDIAVIVVAADDGMMPQTVEAINHAKAAGVPIIVAVNKIDKAGANPDRIKQQLTEFELVPEEWGGNTIYCETSAIQKKGINELLEQIYLLAEVGELKANSKRSATGVVIESRMDKGRGAVATLLIQDGTLKVGQSVVVGTVAGRVRSLINDKGERVQEAGPSVPVEILGLPETPAAGDRFDVCIDEDAAQKVAATRKEKAAQAAISQAKISLEDIFSKLKQGEVKELPIILKTDVAGSAEAIKGMFEKIATKEVKVKVIHSAVGGINESDILLASTAKGIVVGFNVRPDSGAQTAAKREGVEIKTYSIVYELMDDMKKALGGLLAPTVVENQLGRAEVRNTFMVPKIGMIAGCAVIDGKITRQAQVRLVRDGKIIYTGKIGSLKRFKDDVREVASGYECGIGIENFNDIKVGDVIEAFQTETVVREL